MAASARTGSRCLGYFSVTASFSHIAFRWSPVAYPFSYNEGGLRSSANASPREFQMSTEGRSRHSYAMAKLLRLDLPPVSVARRTRNQPAEHLSRTAGNAAEGCSPISLLMQRPSRPGMGPLEALGALSGNRHGSSPRSRRAPFLVLSRSRRFFHLDIFEPLF